ncbi:hypothetical protein ACL00X_14090 [Aeromonas diversa]|uniref:hypothetical protein n=1 Tax=Aeromonas diversa TaxID=502790 RepID=UPI00399F79FF
MGTKDEEVIYYLNNRFNTRFNIVQKGRCSLFMSEDKETSFEIFANMYMAEKNREPLLVTLDKWINSASCKLGTHYIVDNNKNKITEFLSVQPNFFVFEACGCGVNIKSESHVSAAKEFCERNQWRIEDFERRIHCENVPNVDFNTSDFYVACTNKLSDGEFLCDHQFSQYKVFGFKKMQ